MSVILVIDDRQEARRQVILAGTLMGDNTIVYTATDNQDALSKLVQYGSTLDLVLLDMRMEGQKGIILIPHIHRHAPQARILPFTVDEGAAEQMESLGTLERVPKILPAREMAQLLKQALQHPPPPVRDPLFYRYIANDGNDTRIDPPRSSLQIAVLGDSEIEIQGLRSILQRVDDYLPLAIILSTSNAAMIPGVMRVPRRGVVVGTLGKAQELLSLQMNHSLRCVIYAKCDADVSRIPDSLSIIFEAPRLDTVATALLQVADGSVLTTILRTLSPRHRTILRYLAEDLAPNVIAERLNIGSSRMYHLLGEIYRTPGLPDNLDALRVWTHQNIPT